MGLIKGNYYRITDIDGKKWKGFFEKETSWMGRDCLQFSWNHVIIQIALIDRIEEVKETTVQQQAENEGRIDEYNHYGSLYDDGAKRRTKFKYNPVFEGGE